MTGAGLRHIIRALETMYGALHWHWNSATPPFEVAVGAILVQNTAWTNAERALERLRAAGALSPDAMEALPDAYLENLIRPSGQYRQKARKLRSFLATCRAAGGFDALLRLPPAELRGRLLATWGIGPETADCILCYAAKYPAVVIDAYTARLFRRLGLGPARDTYAAWQDWLTAELGPFVPGAARPRLHAAVHAHIVLHAKHRCRKQNPRCGDCLLAPACTYARARQGPGHDTGASSSNSKRGPG